MALLNRVVVAALVLVGATACVTEADQPVATDATAPSASSTTSSTTSTTVESTTTSRASDPCTAIVQDLGPASPLGENVDLVQLAADGLLAPLPVPGAEDAEIVTQEMLDTPADYLAISTLLDPMQRANDLTSAGFASGITQQYEFGPDHYGAFILELGGPERATAYEGIHLGEVCQRATTLRAMTNVPSGASFFLGDPSTALARATFVLGRYEVNLEICTCIEVADRQALAEKWASAIIRDASAI